MNEVRLKVDFSQCVAEFKPMHGVGQPPMTGLSNSLFHYLTRAGIPYSRLHDVGGWLGGGLYVDIPNLFRNFDADENDPASYDFTFTDAIITGLVEAGCEPYFRLGVTIENEHRRKSYRIFPPKDFAKWARICEHVIRHYIDGWCDGFHYDITYWEIWNEPDDCYRDTSAAMWKGTPEQFFQLYSVTSRHLKSCFGDRIKVGGYGHCGLYDFKKDPKLEGIAWKPEHLYEFTINFMHDFLRYQRETNAPIDFFSWHVYDNCHPSTREDFTVIRDHASYLRQVLDRYGYQKTESHLNEWNLWTDRYHRDSPKGAAKTLAFMLMMQNTPTDVMCFYDAGLGFSDYRSLINPDNGTPYRAYYSFAMFNTLYRLGSQVPVTVEGTYIYAAAAKKGKKAAIVLSNPTEKELTLSFDILGFPTKEAQILRVDEENRYTLTGEELADGKLLLPPNATIEIKLWDLH